MIEPRLTRRSIQSEPQVMPTNSGESSTQAMVDNGRIRKDDNIDMKENSPQEHLDRSAETHQPFHTNPRRREEFSASKMADEHHNAPQSPNVPIQVQNPRFNIADMSDEKIRARVEEHMAKYTIEVVPALRSGKRLVSGVLGVMRRTRNAATALI